MNFARILDDYISHCHHENGFEIVDLSISRFEIICSGRVVLFSWSRDCFDLCPRIVSHVCSRLMVNAGLAGHLPCQQHRRHATRRSRHLMRYEG